MICTLYLVLMAEADYLVSWYVDT